MIDLLLISVVLIFIVVGVMKGFARSLLSVVAKIASVIIAYFVSDMYAGAVYESFFKESVIATLESNVDSTLSPDRLADQVLSVWENFPDFLKNIGEVFGVDVLAMKGHLNDVSLSEGIASSLEQAIAGPIAIAICRILLFALVSFLASLVLSVLVNLLCKVVKLPVLRSADKLLGAVVGLVNGLICIFIISFICNIASGLIDNEKITEIINSSYIIDYFAYSGMLI